MPWHLGTRELGDWPTVILAVDDRVSREALGEAISRGAHAIEFRIDNFSSTDPSIVLDTVQRLGMAPTLATIRHASEGGRWSSDEAQRLALYRTLLPHVDGVDCEAKSEICAKLFQEARAQQKLSIASHHDFSDCPTEHELEALLQRADEVQADVVKVAGYCASFADLRRLAAFSIKNFQRGVVVIGMGNAGACSRVFFPALGSLLTYSFLGEPTAPGQLNCEMLVEYLSQLHVQ